MNTGVIPNCLIGLIHALLGRWKGFIDRGLGGLAELFERFEPAGCRFFTGAFQEPNQNSRVATNAATGIGGLGFSVAASYLGRMICGEFVAPSHAYDIDLNYWYSDLDDMDFTHSGSSLAGRLTPAKMALGWRTRNGRMAEGVPARIMVAAAVDPPWDRFRR